MFDLMMPVLEFDSRLYHMSTARLYLGTGSVPYHGGIRFNAPPHLTSMIYLRHWILLGDEGLLKLVNLEFAPILLLLVLYTAREVRAKHLGVPAALFLAAALMAGLVAACLAARRRPGWTLGSLLAIGGGVGFCGIPWWVRSWAHTGNPLYPFFVPGHPDAAALFRLGASFGLGRGFTDFLLLP